MTPIDAPASPADVGAADDVATEVAIMAQLACLLEATAPKPGNVSPGRPFADTRYEDFLASAAAIGGPLAGVGLRPLGATVRLAVEATARWTRANTNLGMILLLTPLARAAIGVRTGDAGSVSAVEQPAWTRLQDAVRGVLEATTVDDAREVYAAIRRAAPGGLGRAAAQDVADEPTMTLLDVMRLAADRDGVAREYATAFERTFGVGAPRLDRSRREGLCWNDAIVDTFLALLAAAPDTHIVRRGGAALAAEVSGRASVTLNAGGVRSEAGRRAIDDMDRALADARHIANPGTTADLTAAAIFVVLVGERWDASGGGADAAAR